MQKGNVVIKQGTTLAIPRGSLSGICRFATATADPRQKHSGERNRLGLCFMSGLYPTYNGYGFTPALVIPQCHSAGYSAGHKAGFTLIELLVVVLIIGILAAVALPQYQKAVERARASEALPLLKSVYQAAQNYQLANGEWPTKFDELAVEIPWTGTTKWRDNGVMKDTRSNNLWSLQLYWESGVSTAIDIGRISGSYKGVGFHVNPSGALACVEKTGEGVIFDGNEGDYCVKIMRCADTHNTYDNGRYYRSCPFRF